MILLLLPMEVFPFQVGYALLLLVSLGLVIFVAQKLKLGLIAVLLIIVSPPVIYTLSHGQVDILVVAGCLLIPAYLVPLVAMIKPQDAILSVLSIPKQSWKSALVVTLAGVGLSFVFFGFWPLVVARVPGPVIDLPSLMRDKEWLFRSWRGRCDDRLLDLQEGQPALAGRQPFAFALRTHVQLRGPKPVGRETEAIARHPAGRGLVGGLPIHALVLVDYNEADFPAAGDRHHFHRHLRHGDARVSGHRHLVAPATGR